MSRFRMSDTEMDESPPTIGYALLVLLSGIYDFDIHLSGDELLIVDQDTGYLFATLEVDPIWGELLLSVLRQVSMEVAKTQCAKVATPFRS